MLKLQKQILIYWNESSLCFWWSALRAGDPAAARVEACSAKLCKKKTASYRNRIGFLKFLFKFFNDIF